MFYVSTRGYNRRQKFCDILLEGLAPDGGLYLPETYPQVDDATLTRWRSLDYAELLSRSWPCMSMTYLPSLWAPFARRPIPSRYSARRR